ncbi:hypothetical protein EVAR_66698_1 [Eumeta japonica]|uniref:Uncharacterized protein n=1 Tax=Eumeta variegata TaxID=151549 RepID=A0A4C1ZIL5_EUMVA|nr:hypothetical protein EVAR_66698_1 [Eumeta japonica]
MLSVVDGWLNFFLEPNAFLEVTNRRQAIDFDHSLDLDSTRVGLEEDSRTPRIGTHRKTRTRRRPRTAPNRAARCRPRTCPESGTCIYPPGDETPLCITCLSGRFKHSHYSKYSNRRVIAAQCDWLRYCFRIF